MNTSTDDELGRLLDETASTYDVPEHGPAEILAVLAERPERAPVLRRRWVQLSAAAAVAVLVTGAALTATGTYEAQLTSGQLDEFSYEGGSGVEKAPAPVAADRNALQSGQDTGAYSIGTATGGSVGTTGNGVGAIAGSADAPTVADDGTDGSEARVVTTGSLALVVKAKRVSATLAAVQKAAIATGGYVASGTSDEASDNPSGELALRVPAARYEGLVAQLRRLDATVRSATTSARDVSAQYADLEAQLRTLRAARERFLVLLGRTRTVGEVLSVQQRVDDVSGRIDRIEGQRKLLANQSDLSSLTVSVTAEGDPVTTQRSGLSQALRDAKDGFVSGVEALIRNSGRALLLVLCLAVAFVAGRLAWRVARRRLV